MTACRSGRCGAPITTLPVATPPTRVPPVKVTVPAQGTDDDVVVFDLRSPSMDTTTDSLGVAIDRSGTVLWEYASYGQWLQVYEAMPDHTLLVALGATLMRLDLDHTDRFHFIGATAHHDANPLPDGRYIFLSFDIFEDQGMQILGDSIRILDQQGTSIEWQWRCRNHIPLTNRNELDFSFDMLGLGHDWTHANQLHFDLEGSAIYLNLRNLNRFYKSLTPRGTSSGSWATAAISARACGTTRTRRSSSPRTGSWCSTTASTARRCTPA